MNLVVLAVSELEMNVVSAERVTEYTSLPSEVCNYTVVVVDGDDDGDGDDGTPPDEYNQ